MTTVRLFGLGAFVVAVATLTIVFSSSLDRRSSDEPGPVRPSEAPDKKRSLDPQPGDSPSEGKRLPATVDDTPTDESSNTSGPLAQVDYAKELHDISVAREFATSVGNDLFIEPSEYTGNPLLNPRKASLPEDVLKEVSRLLEEADELRLEHTTQVASAAHHIASARVLDGLDGGAWETTGQGREVMTVYLTVGQQNYNFVVHRGDSPVIDDLDDVRTQSVMSHNEMIALSILRALD